MAKKAALYVRVSTTSVGKYGENIAFDQRPELQQELLEELAVARGWSVVEVYEDRMSGAESNRPALQRLMSDARRHRFDVVLVWRFDRWSRSVVDFLGLVNELHSVGVDFVAQEQALDTTTPMGRFTLTMFGALAELERAVIRERVAAGLEHARKHGTKSGRAIGRPRVIADRAEIVELRSSGLSWRQIAAKTGFGVGTVRRLFVVASGDTAACQNPSAG